MLDRFRRARTEEEISQRRFTRRQWARRWIELRMLGIALLVVVLVAVGVWLVYFSSVFAIKGVDIEGNSFLADEQVQRAAAVPTGKPLARADIDGVRDRIEDLPAVKSADVSREWPDRLLVRVEERVAIAVVERGGTWRGIDEEGFAFRSYQALPGRLPLIKVDDDTVDEAVAEGALVVASLPHTVARKVEHVELHTVDQISLRLRDGRTIVWGSAENSQDKATVIAHLLKQKGQVYDVSVPGQPTLR